MPEDEWANAVDDLMNKAARQFIEGGYYGMDGSSQAAQASQSDLPPEFAALAGGIGGMPTPAPGLPLGMDPKCALNQFCQKMCRRPVTRHDIIYQTQKWPHGWQATVALHCFHGREFAGEISANRKDAEKSAAMQALRFHSQDVMALAQSLAAPHMRGKGGCAGMRPLMAEALVGPNIVQQQMAQAPQPLAILPGEGVCTPVQSIDAMQAAAAAVPLEANAGVLHNPKSALNAIVMKIARRVPSKEDMTYDTGPVEGGYQSIVRLPIMPGTWSAMAWAGQVCSQTKAAEQSAASAALEMILSDPELSSLLLNRKINGPGASKKAQARKDAKLARQAAAAAQAEEEAMMRSTPSLGSAEPASAFLPVCVNGKALGVVPIAPNTTLFEVRGRIAEARIPGVPDFYLFVVGGQAISIIEEMTRLASTSSPTLNIVSQEAGQSLLALKQAADSASGVPLAIADGKAEAKAASRSASPCSAQPVRGGRRSGSASRSRSRGAARRGQASPPRERKEKEEKEPRSEEARQSSGKAMECIVLS